MANALTCFALRSSWVTDNSAGIFKDPPSRRRESGAGRRSSNRPIRGGSSCQRCSCIGKSGARHQLQESPHRGWLLFMQQSIGERHSEINSKVYGQRVSRRRFTMKTWGKVCWECVSTFHCRGTQRFLQITGGCRKTYIDGKTSWGKQRNKLLSLWDMCIWSTCTITGSSGPTLYT